MKIIKEGKEEERKFICPECHCVFTCTKSECFGYIYPLYTPEPKCPNCRTFLDIEFEDGELVEWENNKFWLPKIKLKLMELWR